MNKSVTLKQVSLYRWELVAPLGHVLIDDLLFASPYKAEEWVKAYITTWNDWKYTLETL